MLYKILDTNFQLVAIVDSFCSSIWTVRYDEAGDFEIILPINASILDYVKMDYYVITEESDRVMIIEDVETITNDDADDTVKVTGRSLEQLLDRRIVMYKLDFKNEYDEYGVPTYEHNLQESLAIIFEDNIINPADVARTIKNFVFEYSDDAYIQSLTLSAQYFGDNIYDIVSNLCKEHQIGFKITLDDKNQFIFTLINGTDRTFDQFKNPWVIFSPENDNLLSSNYYRSNISFKNIAIVAGKEEAADGSTDVTEGEDTYRETVVVGRNDNVHHSGVNRREIFVDGSSISPTGDSEVEIELFEFRAMLRQKGYDALIENMEIEAFEGEIEGTRMYKYGVDFFIGDIVQIVDKYGHEGQAYISEFIISCDEAGTSMYPTFISLAKGE